MIGTYYMRLQEAERIAAEVVETLKPFCERIEIAGSIRRRKLAVGDIEIVAIPSMAAGSHDLFGTNIPAAEYCPGFIMAVIGLGTIRKGNPVKGKYIQVNLPEGINLDLFTARPDNWGLIYAIRTGSAEFSWKVLGAGWVAAGFHSVDGMLTRDGAPVPVREEKDLFRLANVPWVTPEMRFVTKRDSMKENPNEICGNPGGRAALQPV